MGIFRRRARGSHAAPAGETRDGALTSQTQAQELQSAPRVGPFDRAEVDDVSDHVDLGALLLRGVQGMQLRLDLDGERQHVVAATVVLHESTLQLQPFAAPRSGGLWDEIRDEIAASVVARGGTVSTVQGRYGSELHTRVPATDAAGRVVTTPARFLGVDGPRWFLRGVLSGRAALDDSRAGDLLDLFGSVVVVRGDEPKPPRELLTLSIPGEGESAAAPASDPESAARERRAQLNPFERGPEITQVR